MHWTEISDRRVGDVVILDVRGYLTLTEEESSLFACVSRLLEAGHDRLILNLGHVSYIDSVGIGEIVRSYMHLTKRGGLFRLCGVGPRVVEVLQATNLDSILPIRDSEAEALTDLS